MDNTGKFLERLVSQVEKFFLPENFDIETNEKIFNDDGIQIAEFDIKIKGKLGTTEINWLIECRDRPSQGAAPVSWIEQLVGRRTRFNFNKVTAVSTTGFAQGAKEFAEKEGIELRTVKEISIEDIKSWFRLTDMIVIKDMVGLDHADIIVTFTTDEKIINELKEIFITSKDQRFILNHQDNKYYRPLDLFQSAINQNRHIYCDVQIGGRKPINAILNITKENPYSISTKYGDIGLEKIICTGYIIRTEERITFDKIVEYSNEGKEKISELASAQFNIEDFQYELNAHNIKTSGEIVFTFSRINKRNK